MALLKPRKMVSLGELIATCYEQAEKVTPDPNRAAKLAASAVARLLVRTGNARAARRLGKAAA